MANNRFQHKRSSVSGVVPTTGDLSAGELGINLADKKLFTANSSAVFELGSNLTNLNVSSNLSVNNIAMTGALTVNGNISITKNDARLSFTTTAGGSNVYFVQQSDDNFVFATTNSSGSARPVFNVFANTNTPNQNSALRFNGPIDMGVQGIYANNTLGTAGQVLTSNGASVYWSTVSGGGGVAGSNTQVQFNDSGAANASAAFTFDKTSNTLTATLISDAAGKIRDIPVVTQSSAYQLSANDAGECISTSTGGIVVNGAVLAAGFTTTIFNNSAANTTITAGAGVTMYLAGSSSTGNRTLLQRGLATVVCVAANTFAITGSGLF